MTIQPFALLPDPELIEACLKGSGQAWEVLLVRYQRLIYSIPLRYGLPEHDANDVFQNVSLLLWENLGHLRDRARLAAWLVITTRRECWRMMRQHRQNVSTLEGGMLDEVHAAGPLSEEEFLAMERQSQVRAAIGHLESPCRELLTLLFFVDPRPAYSEIAKSLTVPEGSIGPTRSRCLEKLMKILENMGFADA
ncbi:MAG: sigma-70 family RNA polymerase sigma factor [Anaerolineales bacterium]